MADKKRILVAPVDWGLGHATRCIPIIKEIISQGHEVLIAADGRAYDLLKNEFATLPIIRLKGYHPVYPENDAMVFKMLLQVPKFLFAILREHFRLKTLIRDYFIDTVISDNRYGLWSREKTSVFITHQLFIKMPAYLLWLEPLVNRLNHFFIKRFHQCWIPDVAGEKNLSGELSHRENIPSKVEFIGILPRLHRSVPPVLKGNASLKKYDLLVLLSGPEPQRTILENEIMKQLFHLSMHTLVVRGVTEENQSEKLNDFVEVISHLTTKKLREALEQSEAVVCRAGYSSLMELVSLQKKALIIPTPGQTEQEYLAARCRQKKYFVVQEQGNINLPEAVTRWRSEKFDSISFDEEAYKIALAGLIGKI